MSRPFRWSLIWLFCGTLSFILCLGLLKTLIIQNEWVPAHQDCFYHARRIIDTALEPGAFYQFDAKIHGPEGSLLTWPWAFDAFFGMMLHYYLKIFPSPTPMNALAVMPSLWTYVNCALFLSLAALLDLSLIASLFAGVFYALLPRIVLLHRAGDIDHHFMEFTLTLLTVNCTLGLFKHQRRYLAIGLGLVLGAAPAFQTSLFVLQIPVLLSFLLLWYVQEPIQHARSLALSLVISTLLFLLPSLPWQMGRFDYFTHSWLHLYISVCSAFVLFFIDHFTCSRKNLSQLILASGLLALPLLSTIKEGTSFILSRMAGLQGTQEMLPAWDSPSLYSPFLYFFPVFLSLYFVKNVNIKRPMHISFMIFSVVGGFMLLRQIRFAYFGLFVLVFPMLYVLDKQWIPATKKWRLVSWLALSLIILCTFYNGLKEFWHMVYFDPDNPSRKTPLIGSELSYELNFELLGKLKQQCQGEPGLVLSDPHLGNPIRYHTNCSVLANRMLITPQHFAKADRARQLFQGTVADFLNAPELFNYVFVSLRGTYEAAQEPSTPESAFARRTATTPVKKPSEASTHLIEPVNSNETKPQDAPSLLSFGLRIEQPTYQKALFTILLYEEVTEWGDHFELLAEQSIEMPDRTRIRWSRLFKVKRPVKSSFDLSPSLLAPTDAKDSIES